MLILLLPALQPLFTADLTAGYDNGFHLWRAVELEHLLRQGVLFSRWAPDMAHGYGYPLFNFAAPASAYGVAFLHLLGLPWPGALNVLFALGWLLSAYAMYLCVSDLFGRYAGLLAAVLYAYAPSHAYDVFYRGGLSQSSAWLFPPLILWALRRADRRLGFGIAAVGTAGLVLTHNAFALLFAPLFLLYLLVVGRERGRRAALWGGLALLVGLGLSSFFWLPALAELGFVHSERASGAWVFEYVHNFLPPDQLFALPRNADPRLINDWPARGMGLIPALLALLGLLALRDRRRSARVALFALALVVCLFLILPASRPVWDTLPLLQKVQFPWRLTGPATLCAAVLGGAFLWRPTDQLGGHCILPVALIALVVLGSLGWFYPRHGPAPSDISISGMLAWERQTDTIGTTALGEFLPIWVEQMPQGTHLEEQIAAGGEALRLDETALPEGAAVVEADYGVNRARLVVDSPQPFRARYLAFYYPGWRVWVDGEPVEVAPTDPDGLVGFDVPAGRHTVAVRFGETPLRLAADALSAVALLALVALALRCQTLQANQQTKPATWNPILLPLLALLLLVLKLTVVDHLENPLRRSNLQGDRLRQVDVPAQLTFDGQFRLLGYDALPEESPGDQPLAVRLYWQDTIAGGPDYQVGLALKDGQGLVWNDPDLRPPRWHRAPPPAYLWPPDEYAVVAFDLQPLPGIPPGIYTVTLGVFDRVTLAPQTARNADGQALGPEIPLGRVQVVRPRQLPTLDEIRPRHRLDVPFGPLRLVGYSTDREQAAPGDPFLLTLFWQADGPPVKDLFTRLRLLDAAGVEMVALALPPVAESLPTTRWQAGDLWRGQHLLRLPAGLESGEHQWILQVCHMEGAECRAVGQEVALASLEVHAPERLWVAPSLDVETSALLGNIVTFLGANVEPGTRNLRPGAFLTVTIAWRAETEMDTSYRVFLHLLGPGGELVAQSDGEPADWTRPTTGWLPGEVVLDERVLLVPGDAPPGEYSLQAGMYTLEGSRLTTAAGADAIPLGAIWVE